tara:strand:- start:58 stop:282 length:225 start_codon:yes stop_codon:yes gene_type:complete
MKLSNQAVGAVMMALQKSLMEQTDIVPVLRDFKLEVDDSGEVVIMNPPVVRAGTDKAPTVTTRETDSSRITGRK